MHFYSSKDTKFFDYRWNYIQILSLDLWHQAT